MVAPSFRAAYIVAGAPFDRELDAFRKCHAQIVLRGRIEQLNPVAPAAIAARIA